MRLPKFLDLYMEYTSGNETPESMHLWSGLSVLAGAAEKRLWINIGFSREGLNLYVILLGPPGVVAKSTALKLAKTLLRKAGYNVMEGSVTKEKIMEDLLASIKTTKIDGNRVIRQTPVTYIANEVFTLLSSGVDMVKFLTDIWNEDNWTYKTKTSGEFTIPNVAFNLLGATTPQWFSSSLFGDLTATGFIARCIIVYESAPRGQFPFVSVTQSQIDARDQLLQMLGEMRQFYGPVEMGPEAAQYYADWYVHNEIRPGEDHRMAAYLERKRKIFVFKVSSLLALGDMRTTVQKEDIETALEIFDRVEVKMRAAYRLMGDNMLMSLIQRAILLLKASDGKMSHINLGRHFIADIDIDGYKKLLEQMSQLGLVTLHREGKTLTITLTKDGVAFAQGG